MLNVGAQKGGLRETKTAPCFESGARQAQVHRLCLDGLLPELSQHVCRGGELMKAIDYRNHTWEALRSRLSGLRMQVYTAFVHHGPGTTWQISDKSGISILTLRPRTTELLQLGFIEILEGSENSREAVYVSVPVDMVQDRFEWLKKQPIQAEFPY
jgi:hypothetical protein